MPKHTGLSSYRPPKRVPRAPKSPKSSRRAAAPSHTGLAQYGSMNPMKQVVIKRGK